jgi:hypothetical protein
LLVYTLFCIHLHKAGAVKDFMKTNIVFSCHTILPIWSIYIVFWLPCLGLVNSASASWKLPRPHHCSRLNLLISVTKKILKFFLLGRLTAPLSDGAGGTCPLCPLTPLLFSYTQKLRSRLLYLFQFSKNVAISLLMLRILNFLSTINQLVLLNLFLIWVIWLTQIWVTTMPLSSG